MYSIILLLLAADPTGLPAAFESAETVDVSHDWIGFKVTLVNPETIKKLAPLVEVKGEPERLGLPATPEIIRVTIHGKKTTEFWMTKSKIAYSDKQMIACADDKLWLSLRKYFEPPAVDKPAPGIEPPTDAESVQKTLNAAMRAADKLEVTYRKVTIPYPAGGDGIRNVHLNNLKVSGDVTNAKKPEDPVEVVFVNKETRTPIYLVGDTVYWGGDKRWKSMKLIRDSMWKQFVKFVPSRSRLEGDKPEEPVKSAFPAK